MQTANATFGKQETGSTFLTPNVYCLAGKQYLPFLVSLIWSNYGCKSHPATYRESNLPIGPMCTVIGSNICFKWCFIFIFSLQEIYKTILLSDLQYGLDRKVELELYVLQIPMTVFNSNYFTTSDVENSFIMKSVLHLLLRIHANRNVCFSCVQPSISRWIVEALFI